MQIAAKESFSFMGKAPYPKVIAESSATYQAGFYQQIVSPVLACAIRNEQIDADRLVAIGTMAHRRRQPELVEVVSRLLIDLPFGKRYELFGRYFEGLWLFHRKNYKAAKLIFERLLPVSEGILKARTMMALAAVVHFSGKENSLPYYLEAGAIASEAWRDPYTVVQVSRMVAMHKSIVGDHHGAVSDLERMLPIAKVVGASSPFLLLEHLNSLAYEKLETGNIGEANRILSFALTSPLAKTYPPCHETYNEIAAKMRRRSRSIIALNSWHVEPKPARLTENLIFLPATTIEKSESDGHDKTMLARVLAFKLKTASELSEDNQPVAKPLPIASKPLKCKPDGDTDYTIDCSQVRTLTMRFLDAAGQERMKVEVRQDEDGAIADVWVRDREGNGHSFFSTCFADNPTMEIDLP